MTKLLHVFIEHNKDELQKLLNQLRNKTKHLGHKNKKQDSTNLIQRLTGLNHYFQRKIFSFNSDQNKKQSSSQIKDQLNEQDLLYLVDPNTLKRQANLSLFQRCYEFNQLNPSKKLSVCKLRMIYKDHKIKKRSLRFDKTLKESKIAEQRFQRLHRFKVLVDLIESGQDIHWADEVVFSDKLQLQSVWAPQGKTFQPVKKKAIHFVAQAFLCSMNNAGQITALVSQKQAIDQFGFVEFLNCLRRNHPKQQSLNLVVDNHPIHYTHRVVNFCQQNRINIFYLPIYSSQFNPIEYCWAYAKRELRKRLVHCDFLGSFKKMNSLISDCIYSVKPSSLSKRANRCYGLMLSFLSSEIDQTLISNEEQNNGYEHEGPLKEEAQSKLH